MNFGKAADQEQMLSRIRLGLSYEPASWFRISGLAQDSRVSFYGVTPPATLHDPLDLEGAEIDLGARGQNGFSTSFGRSMLNYGESRVVGSPQWSNVSRTFDFARVRDVQKRYVLEALMVSPVKVLPGLFNKPDLGERIWGTYNTFPGLWKGLSLDAYALRHSQNRPGGWNGSGTLGTNSFGGRIYGKAPGGIQVSTEGIGQTGHVGLASHKASAWFVGAGRKWDVRPFPLAFFVDYATASGTRANSAEHGTYDQLSPSNHDKFGHQDLFGWRNLRTAKLLGTASLTKKLSVNLMYANHWLNSSSDSLYNSQGVAIATSATGRDGTHIGQELDSFVTYTRGAHQFGAGAGHFFNGEFARRATPNVNPRYFYIFQQYSFK